MYAAAYGRQHFVSTAMLTIDEDVSILVVQHTFAVFTARRVRRQQAAGFRRGRAAWRLSLVAYLSRPGQVDPLNARKLGTWIGQFAVKQFPWVISWSARRSETQTPLRWPSRRSPLPISTCWNDPLTWPAACWPSASDPVATSACWPQTRSSSSPGCSALRSS